MEAVQLYNGLRFNDKNVILLSYPDEGHGLSTLANRRDLTIRMQEFFDHYLMDSTAPGWMVDAVPFLKKKHGAWRRGSEESCPIETKRRTAPDQSCRGPGIRQSR